MSRPLHAAVASNPTRRPPLMLMSVKLGSLAPPNLTYEGEGHQPIS